MIALYWYVLGAGFLAYVLTAGADFGGGVWDLFASGPRRLEQRRAVEQAIAPIWEANHVWLIFVIVLLFTAFPLGFAAIATALHIPLTLALIGIVLRGASFTFRAYGLEPTRRRELWGRVFAWSSLLTPLVLGMALAALSTGEIHYREGVITSGYRAGWLTSFAWSTGAFALILFSLLAAVYLAAENEGAVREDFSRRAQLAELAGAFFAALTAWRAASDAPLLFANLARSAWTWPVQIGTALAAIATIVCLRTGHFRVARFTVATQVALVISGWGLAMDRHLILADLPLDRAGARSEVLEAVAPVIGIGSLLLLPALYYLLSIFKSQRASERRKAR